MQTASMYHGSHKHPNHWMLPMAFFFSFFVLYYAAMPLLDDPDMPWHLATGALLLNTHILPTTDPWSFASNGAPWYLLSWLWNIILGLLNNIVGHFGIFVFAITLYSLIITMQASRLLYLGIDRQAVILTLMLMLLSMVEFTSARPQLAGYVMILLFQHILHNSRSRQRPLLFLPLLMVAWVNMHGSFIAGFTLLAAYIVDALFSKHYRWMVHLLCISIACLGAMLMNPYGIDIITGALQSIDSDVKEHLIEWKPFEIGASIGLTAWVLLFVLTANFRNKSIPLADKLISFAWFFATLFIMRNGAIFILVSAPYFASCLDIKTKNLREKPHAGTPPSWVKKLSIKQLWGSLASILVVFTLISGQFFHKNRLESVNHSIRDAINYIQNSPYSGHYYLSDFDFGGQIIYYGQGKVNFFMDSRSNTAYNPREMKNYLSYWLLKPNWQESLKEYGINGIIAHQHSRFVKAHKAGQYNNEWHLMFAGNIANVYIAAP